MIVYSRCVKNFWRKVSGSPPNNSVLVPTGTGFTWPTAEYDYQVLQRKSDDTIGFDWLRFS